MRFNAIGGCRRKVREQKYIFAMLGAWDSLPLERRAELRLLISSVCSGAEEERALFDVLVRQREPEAAAARTGITIRRLYALRREFYERAEIR